LLRGARSAAWRLAGTAAPLDECARDVIALSAALQPESTYILTIAAAPVPGHRYATIWSDSHSRPRAIRARPEVGPGTAFWPAAARSPRAAAAPPLCRSSPPVILALPDGWSETDWC